MKKVGTTRLIESVWRITHLVVWFSAIPMWTSLAANNELRIPPNVTCACPNEVLTFTCTTVGSGATIWKGSAFQCPTGEIILRHNAFPQSGDCNDIVGESVGVQGDCYTSRLRVPIDAEVNNRNVQCLYNSDTMTLIREAQISVITGPYQEAPTRVRITQVNSRELNVTWMPLDTNCPSIDYSIIYPCGTCRVTTETTAICSDLQLPSNCTLTIQSVICGHVGAASNPIRVLLKVPDKPVVNLVPVYSADSYTLIGFRATIDKEASFSIADGISSSVTSYSITYSQNTKNFQRNISCIEASCEYMVYVELPTVCSLSSAASLNATLSASNMLGHGPPSNPMVIGCKNDFIQVEYHSTISAIVCRFLDQTDISLKSCTVMYGQCNQALAYISEGNSTIEAPNHIMLSVDAGRLDCYVITASSNTTTVVVTGMRMTTAGNVNVIAATVVPILIFIVMIAIVLIVLIVLFMIIKRRSKEGDLHRSIETTLGPVSNQRAQSEREVIKQLDLQPVDKKNFQICEVENDCELKEFVKNELKCEYKRGCVFYEFEHDFERISDDKLLIFMDKENELFSPGLDAEGLKQHRLVGDEVSRPDYRPFTLFVQSTGSGIRHLKGGTKILYQKKDCSWQREQLRPIVSNHLKLESISSDTTIKSFRDRKNLQAKRCNVFLELKNVSLSKKKKID